MLVFNILYLFALNILEILKTGELEESGVAFCERNCAFSIDSLIHWHFVGSIFTDEIHMFEDR